MIILATIIILLACAALAFFVLIQNPKGGGLSGTFGSVSSQIMGVKQSGDIMEKSTWTAMGVIAALCIISVTFLDKPKMPAQSKQPAPSGQQQTTPAQAPAKK